MFRPRRLRGKIDSQRQPTASSSTAAAAAAAATTATVAVVAAVVVVVVVVVEVVLVVVVVASSAVESDGAVNVGTGSPKDTRGLDAFSTLLPVEHPLLTPLTLERSYGPERTCRGTNCLYFFFSFFSLGHAPVRRQTNTEKPCIGRGARLPGV